MVLRLSVHVVLSDTGVVVVADTGVVELVGGVTTIMLELSETEV